MNSLDRRVVKILAPYVFTLIIIIIVIIIIIALVNKSKKIEKDKVNKPVNKEEELINNKIKEYKEKGSKINYYDINEVKSKLPYVILSKVEYNEKTNNKKLRFATIDELTKYETELNQNKETKYTEVYNNSISILTEGIKWLNPMGNGLGLSPNARIAAAAGSIVKNATVAEKTIYTYLSKNGKLEEILKGLMSAGSYVTLIQSPAGIVGLMGGALL
jgi:hypothetical protein